MADDYITVQEAAAILKLSTRMVNKYGHEGKLQTRKAGKRLLYRRADVQALAEELAVDVTLPPAPPPPMDLVPAGEMLQHIKERDARIDELHTQLVAAAVEIGTLRERLDHQTKLLEEERQKGARTLILDVDNPPQKKSWWQRLFA
ncbi:MAG: helix-turn-helix domain-containing protein [Chloroflexota bacterium]|nr:helix-turn-helix domain-containing protein [Chloroflexota bacterium]